jgi:predicted O-linked N-acetylglucosamine transferase (SPINDLY family)
MIYQCYFHPSQQARLFPHPPYRPFGLEPVVNPTLTRNCPELEQPQHRLHLLEFAAMLHLWRNPPADGDDWIGFTSWRQLDKCPTVFRPGAMESALERGEVVTWFRLDFPVTLAPQAERWHPGLPNFLTRMFQDLGLGDPEAYSRTQTGIFASYWAVRKADFTAYMEWFYPALAYCLRHLHDDPYLQSKPKASSYALERLFMAWCWQYGKRIVDFTGCKSPLAGSVVDLFTLGLRHQQAGQYPQAEQVLRQVLALDPRHGGALHLLGVMAYQSGRLEVAAECFRQAVDSNPSHAIFQSSLGAAYQELGRLAEAAACHQEALRLSPQDPLALNNLGITLAAQGKHTEAVAVFRQILAVTPDDPEVLCNLAAALNGQDQIDEAIAIYQRVLRLRPDLAQAHNNLGNALRAKGQVEDAVACYQQAIRLWPGFAAAHNHLGQALQTAGKLDQAIPAYRQAVQIKPDLVEAHVNLGGALLEKQRYADALACHGQALRLRPDSSEAYNGLGNVYYAQGNLDEAVANYQHALRCQPDFSVPHYNLGVARQAQGKLTEARDCFQEALRLKPDDDVAHSTYLGSLVYNPRIEPAVLLAEHRRWAEQHAAPTQESPCHDNHPDPQRRLRVGYVSPDFRSHAVAYFLRPILTHHDREKVEAFGYADVAVPDGETAVLRSLAHQWRDTFGLSTERLVELIRQDRIDILVDLTGHTAHNRLLVFARKPAPVQVSYLGYPCTTGLPTIDYRLVDPITDPPGEPPSSSEELVRLPGCFCCYAPPRHAPDVSPLPARRRGVITFGSLHKLEKLNPDVLDLWCRILRDVPSAHLLVSRNTLQGQTAADLRRQFEDRGIAPSRLVFERIEPVNLQHLRLYHDMDVALDPFPWNGHTTACEALWMGVPVLALRGQRHASRMVASVLCALGLTDWLAETPEDYHRLAVQWAGDWTRLADLRWRLRSLLSESVLCDGAAFTRGLEAAYRQMWQRWCKRICGPTSGGVE